MTSEDLVRDMLIKKEKMIKAQTEYIEAQTKWKLHLIDKDKIYIQKRAEVHLLDKKKQNQKSHTNTTD